MKYIKPTAEVLFAEFQMLSASGSTRPSDTFHNANTQKDSSVDFGGRDEKHPGDDDLEAAKRLRNWQNPLWEWNN